MNSMNELEYYLNKYYYEWIIRNFEQIEIITAIQLVQLMTSTLTYIYKFI